MVPVIHALFDPWSASNRMSYSSDGKLADLPATCLVLDADRHSLAIESHDLTNIVTSHFSRQDAPIFRPYCPL